MDSGFFVSVVRCMVIILWKGAGRSRGINNPMWRYGLTGDRYRAVRWWCRGEALRCEVSSSANLEKTGSFVVKNENKWLVFWCTVNWARARLRIALIVDGATESSAV